ncbi:hypothetical protein K492DRAFT_241191 [Lichtheimia hyalospora FSU 10163]|nr:hypothetical protein K492DRAFT_241191 [Lichtheimia hyalospora FSU 10163]
MDIVMRHHSTLEHLAINLQCDMNPSQSRQFMKSQIQFYRLAHVHFGISKPHPFESQSSNEQLIKDACEFFGNVLSRSSNINTLRLSGEALDPAVLRCSLGQLQHLCKIVIGNHYLSSVDEGLSASSEDTLKQILDEHIDYHSINKTSCTSELKELKFVSHQINKPLLGTITRLSNLEKLSIYVGSRFGSEQIPFIDELYSQCPKLSDLTIKATTITDGVIFQLSKRNQLEHLTLHADEKMNDAALLSLIPCSKLKVLRIPRSVSSDVVRVIQDTLPKLEIKLSMLSQL